MDTSQQVTLIPRNKETSVLGQRQRRSIAEKRRIVEETLAPGASVARVARLKMPVGLLLDTPSIPRVRSAGGALVLIPRQP